MSGFRAFVVACALCVGGIGVVSLFNRAPASDDPPAPTPTSTSAPAARTFFKIGEHVTAYFGDFGCPTVDHRKALQKLAAEDDHIAEALAATKYDCVLIAPREVGVVEDSSVWSGLSCVRRQGEPECLWYPTPVFITEAEAAANDSRDAADKAVLDKMDADYDASPKGIMELSVLAAFLKSRRPGQLGYGLPPGHKSGSCDPATPEYAKGDLKAGDGSQVSWIYRPLTPAERKLEEIPDDDGPQVWECTPFLDHH